MENLKFNVKKSDEPEKRKLEEIEQLGRKSANKVYGEKISKKVATQIYFDEELLNKLRKESMSNKLIKNKELDSIAKIVNHAVCEYYKQKGD
ncbi:hypothetical protein ACFVMS_004487 [Salmonella enterica]